MRIVADTEHIHENSSTQQADMRISADIHADRSTKYADIRIVAHRKET